MGRNYFSAAGEVVAASAAEGEDGRRELHLLVCDSGCQGIGLATATRKVELDKNMVNEESFNKESSKPRISDVDLSFGERAFSAGAAAFISAIIVNPLDVAKMLRDRNSMPSSVRATVGPQPKCSPDCTRYRGTSDVLYKVIRQVGELEPEVGMYMPLYDIFRNYMEELTSLNAPTMTPYVPLVAGSLARSIACVTCYPVELAKTRMQAFKHSQADAKPPGVWKTMIGVVSPVKTANNHQACMILRRNFFSRIGEEASASSVLGANFCAGFVAGSLAAATTCPLDVARTRRQIEKDTSRALKMTTRQTLIEIWRYPLESLSIDGGIRGLFTGVGPRVARAGPSVGIVVSFYEVVKFVLHYTHS
ncbi:hypothetical protein DH2020_025208 [Rehmannia glutinosa]|uniref:Mitochondrial carrier protein n=1 Tax=Rehmannia glutinosa TaxID=99300 RepID=A0ABR0W2S8_REHGL